MSGASLFRVICCAALPLVLTACTTVGPEVMSQTPPPPPPQPPEVRLVAAIENAGCVMTAENLSVIQLNANVTQAEVAEIVPRLADAGRVEVAGTGAIRVLTDNCI